MNCRTISPYLKHYQQIEQTIIKACERGGRCREEVNLVAVSKTRTIEQMYLLAQCGVSLFGENKVQEVLEKRTFFEKPNHELHFIGHLQTNKVNKILPLVDIIHSVDSLKLLDKVYNFCESYKKKCGVFLQVNIAKESTKYGFSPEELKLGITYLKFSKYVKYLGLMNIAPRIRDAEKNRSIFSQTKHLLNQIQKYSNTVSSLNLLSMGMSQDYEVAIEEGSNYIRLGTILFEME